MRKLAALLLALAIAVPAHAQVPKFPQTVPPNTVVGRLGAGVAGPTQAIPFTTLFANIVGCTLGTGTCIDLIGGFSSTGVMARTSAGSYAFRTITGTASQITVTNGDGVAGNPTLSLPSISANTALGNFSGSAAAPSAQSMPSCSTTTSALQYTNGSGLSCYTSSASLAATGQTITGGAVVTSQSQSTGNITIDCGSRPLQYITNNGAYTITSPANDGSCILFVTNGASAGATSFSGFSVGSNTGDALTTTNTNKFSIFIWRINGTSGYRIAAHQ